MFGMHHQSHKIITVRIQTEQHTDAYIIYASLHGTVHGFRMIGIIAFGTGGMQGFVIFLMIGFLKENVSTDACLLQKTVILHRSSGNIHIHPTDSPVFMVYAVNGTDRFQYIFDGVTARVLTGFQCQPFMSHVLQCNHLPAYLLLRQLLAGNGTVLGVVRAIDTAVYTIIGKIQRSEHDNAVAIKFPFDFLCQMKDAARQIRLVALQ